MYATLNIALCIFFKISQYYDLDEKTHRVENVNKFVFINASLNSKIHLKALLLMD